MAPMHSYVTHVLVYNLHMTIFSRVYSYVTRVYSYVTRMYSYVLVCYSCVARMLLAYYSYVLVCYSYVLVCTRILLVCTRMLLVCYSCVVLVTIRNLPRLSFQMLRNTPQIFFLAPSVNTFVIAVLRSPRLPDFYSVICALLSVFVSSIFLQTLD